MAVANCVNLEALAKRIANNENNPDYTYVFNILSPLADLSEAQLREVADGNKHWQKICAQGLINAKFRQ
jgi:hypothetical protein